MLTEADDRHHAASLKTHVNQAYPQTDAETLKLEDLVADPQAEQSQIDYEATIDKGVNAQKETTVEPKADHQKEITVQKETTPQQEVAITPSGLQLQSGPVGYTAFRESQPQVLDETGKPVKKVGRPVGWKKSVHGRGARGVPPKIKGKKKQKTIASQFMVDVLSEEILAKRIRETRPLENTIEDDMDVDMTELKEDPSLTAKDAVVESQEIKFKVPDNTWSSEGEETIETQVIQTSDTAFSLAEEKTTQNESVPPVFWEEVLECADVAEKSTPAGDNSCSERKDSVMEDVELAIDQEAAGEVKRWYAVRSVLGSGSSCNAASEINMVDVPVDKAHEPLITSKPNGKAAAEVFGTKVLVERILLSMPRSEEEYKEAMRTILLSQRVSKTFCQTIRGSQQLQEVLFFRRKHASTDTADLRLNPLLNGLDALDINHVFLCYERKTTVIFFTDEEEGIAAPTRVVPHPAREPSESWYRMLLCQSVPMGGKLEIGACATIRGTQRVHRHKNLSCDLTLGRAWDMARPRSGGPYAQT